MSRDPEWKHQCEATPEGDDLPPGVPSVGGKTWDIYEQNKQMLAANLIEAAMQRAAQRRPIQEILR